MCLVCPVKREAGYETLEEMAVPLSTVYGVHTKDITNVNEVSCLLLNWCKEQS